MISETLMEECRVMVNPNNFTFEAFDGKFRCTPEMLADLEAYYKITPDSLFEMILNLEKTNQFYDEGEIDVHVRQAKTLRPDEHQVWELAIVQGPATLLKTYFATTPIKRFVPPVTKE